MSGHRRGTVKVPIETHRNIKLIAAALRIRQADVVTRAVAHYRLRHAKRIDELMRQEAVGDLRELTLRERLDLLVPYLKEQAFGSRIWVCEDRANVVLVMEPLPWNHFDLAMGLEEKIGADVSIISRGKAQERGWDMADARPL